MLMNPSVNINGTSRDELVNTRIAAMDALMDAMAKMEAFKPHGRDYVGRDHQYSLDRALYAERFSILDKMRNEIMDEALAIQEAGPRGWRTDGQ
jgi:hypothetical protein